MSNMFHTEINGSGSGPQNATWEWNATDQDEQVNCNTFRFEAGDVIQFFLNPFAAGTLVIESLKMTRISDEMPP